MRYAVQFFELIVIEKSSRRILTHLPVARQAWGTFTRGELFRFENRYFPIDQLINEYTTRDNATLCRTILLVGPVLPETALSDVTIPDAAPFPENDPPGHARERRGWWPR